jgi:hypothetical protein
LGCSLDMNTPVEPGNFSARGRSYRASQAGTISTGVR